LLGVVAKLAPKRRHGLVDRVGANRYLAPSAIQKLFDADNLAGTVGERQEQAHCADVEPRRVARARDFAGRGIDEPVADEQFWCWAFHSALTERRVTAFVSRATCRRRPGRLYAFLSRTAVGHARLRDFRTIQSDSAPGQDFWLA